MDLVERPRYVVVQNENVNVDERVKLMLNEINEQEFKRIIQKREKAYEKKRDITLLISMFVDSMGDFMRQTLLSVMRLTEFLENAYKLSAYANSQLKVISHRYDCVVPIIHSGSISEEVRILSLRKTLISSIYTEVELQL